MTFKDALRMLAWTVGPKDGKARLAYMALIDMTGAEGVGCIEADVLRDRACFSDRVMNEQLGALASDGFITLARPRGDQTLIFFQIAQPIVARARSILSMRST
ncbi:hypothetical protein C2I36_08020 [Rhodobacteraceae bacterium WD3A24]|nr:hypothetical protein C2I36_08020 [Rhodobacteraceae bacterium WD3A24]